MLSRNYTFLAIIKGQFIMGYAKEALRGISWLGASRVFIRVVSLIRLAIIARVLTPSQLGLFGIASLVLVFSEIVTETGINVLLLQEKHAIDRVVNTAWIVSIVRGFIISLLIFITAPFVATFFSAPDSIFLIRLISIVPLLRGFINPSIISFHKDLQFRSEFYYRSAIYSVDALLAVLFTLLLKSPTGIIIGFIGGVMLEVILSFYVVKPRPSLRFQKEIFLKILRGGKWVTLVGIFNYLFENADDIVVGKLLGTTALGLYDMSYRISMLPTTEGSDVISKVTFPIYVKIVDEKERLRKGFIKMVLLISVLLLPVAIVFLLFPSQMIYFILGPKWLSAAPLLQVLGVYGVIRAISNTAQPLFYALKRQDIVSKVSMFSFLVLITTIFFFIERFGLVGAAYAALTATIVAVPYIIYNVYSVLRRNTPLQG